MTLTRYTHTALMQRLTLFYVIWRNATQALSGEEVLLGRKGSRKAWDGDEEWRQKVRELDPRGAEKALTQCSLTRDSRSVKAIRVVQNPGDSPRRTE